MQLPALHKLGVTINLEQPAAVAVHEVAEAYRAAFQANFTKYLEDTKISPSTQQAVGQGGALSASLPEYLEKIHKRSRRKALAQLRTGPHRLAEETGRWQRQPQEERFCPHWQHAGEHVQDVAHTAFRTLLQLPCAYSILSCLN